MSQSVPVETESSRWAIHPTHDVDSKTKDQARQSKLWIMMPAFNEEIGIRSLIQKIGQMAHQYRYQYEIVVVDDASTDQTAKIASQLSFHFPVSLVQHSVNQGLAGAMRTGFEFVIKRGQTGDIVVTLDADDTQPPATIPAMVTKLHEGYDVIIASRYQPGSRTLGVPRHRLAMTWLAKWMFKILTPIEGVWDYTCGFRAYRFEILSETMSHYGDQFISEKGFSCMVDVLLKMRPFGWVMGEVPMLLRYDQKEGASKMNVSKTATQTIQLLIKRRMGKL
ncbi:MAG: glycosyltransferase family 2 protein [Planctomycetota bacterium]